MSIYVYKRSNGFKNKVFSFCCILLAIWSFGFAFSNQATNVESALLWRRLSAIGWGSFYSFFLHFIILLTAKADEIKAKWLYVLIYAPAIFTVYVFSLNSSIAVGQYDLHLYAGGWINHSINNLCDKIFNIYYIVFLGICLIMLIRWAIVGIRQDKISASVLSGTLLLAATLGSFTDIILGIYFPGLIPQMAPLFILIPVSSIFLLIRKNDFLNEKHPDAFFQEGHLLNEDARGKLNNYLSIFLAIGASITIIASHFIFKDDMYLSLVVASVYWVLAVLNSFIPKLNLSMEKKEFLSTLIMLLDTFQIPFILTEQEYFVSCSAGVSVYPVDGEDSQTLVKNADIAMYTSKKHGKNQCSFCTSTIKEDIVEKVELTNYLYRALDRNEFEVYYQQQLCISNKKIIGFEALLRWNHPDKGLLLPGKFINLAENTRLIIPIGKWVMETACKQLKHWNDMGFNSLLMAVNLSLIQLVDSDIIKIIKNIISESGIDPKNIELEVTESIATNKSLNIDLILNELKALDVSISIDDFGTEYSSLARLKTLPIDRIKMDMQFVHSISRSSKDDAIVRIIILLAKNLNLNIIAEGIETETQLNFLSMNDCDEVQGFLYYKPLKANDAEKLLLEQRIRK